MKLQSLLVAQLLAAGDVRGACNAMLQHFGAGPLAPNTEIRVNERRDQETNHILAYLAGEWYEWGAGRGFRRGVFSQRRHVDRVVVWRKATKCESYLLEPLGLQ